jgi:hypothetical protein
MAVDRLACTLEQALGRRYVAYFNTRYRRTGTLWEGRFKSSLVDSERYVLPPKLTADGFKFVVPGRPVRLALRSNPRQTPGTVRPGIRCGEHRRGLQDRRSPPRAIHAKP